MSTEAPELVWRFVGQPAKRMAKGGGKPCEACEDPKLNVWRRVGKGMHGINLTRCWLHGPGMDGRECDGPEGARG